ncbi:BQ5605_C005g03487 [Microbotryum silenes-dioicae]|uniref:BQ5605_C005g03487 protein n=1 Tax=Microbotryum silenes-dioicae TaxID=796604 RepID=A0A2X0PCZ1_9BASI|nr:BQ5605_C005g03487 [Microbotryum silenes-dioicae]
MSKHVANAPYVAIHSVCVSARHRRQGIARSLLDAYVAHLSRLHGIRGARLITHNHLIPLYRQAGFELIGESSVVHGREKWFEMKIDFNQHPEAEQRSEPAHSEDETSIRNPGTKFISLGPTPLAQLVDSTTQMNSADLYCPRADCRCLLVKRGTAKFVQSRPDDLERSMASPAELQPQSLADFGLSARLSHSKTLAFHEMLRHRGRCQAIKYLICADCDFGPLGWHDTEGRDLGVEVAQENEGQTGNVRSGREFLLAVDRLRYRIVDE